MDRTAVISQLRARGWTVKEGAESSFQLPAAIAARYPNLPTTLLKFLSGLAECIDGTETIWFLCQSDYEGTSESAFRWDAWEQLSLEAAEGDPAWIAEIRRFWDHHFPFLLSVKDGYAYYAVCTAEDRFGQIVEGREPEFEGTSPVADSFKDFLAKLGADEIPN